MAARLINPDGSEVKNKLCKISGTFQPVKKQYERVNGVFVPVYYDGYVLYNGLTTDGTAYIDLGNKGYGSNTHIVDFTLTTLSGNVGVYGNRAVEGNWLGVFYHKNDNNVNADNQKSGTENRFSLSNPTIGRYLVTFSATKTTILHDGVLSTKIYTKPICSETYNNLEVFRYPIISTPVTYYQNSLTVHSIEEYSPSGLLLHQYVPARRISDAVLGLLDVVNGVFHTNAAGSGAFTVS